MADERGSLKTYREKRNFEATPEPAEGGVANENERAFVIQKHWATRLHYDFRLELDGVMKSWAVPKGPSFDPADKRMAMPTEDHPIAYNRFEGTIPAGNYGAGKVIIWDKGVWVPLGDPRQGLRDGKLKFEMRGHKLHGHWTLVRMKGRGDGKREDPWLLIKERDGFVRPAAEYSVVDERADSVQDLDDRPAEATAGSDSDSDSDSNPPAATSGPPPGAREAALPEEFQPQLATLVDAPPGDPEHWIYEIKFDGYRMLARAEGGNVRLITRNGNDWTHRMPELVRSLQAMELPDGWYDGEIIMPGEKVPADFQALQSAFDSTRTADIVYYLFDLPYCAGHDLRGCALEARREVLQRIVERKPQDKVRFSGVFDAAPEQVLASACHLGLEGVIAKRRGSGYSNKRSSDWIKLKCGRRQEFVIGGYTDPQGSRLGIGSLLLGVHDEQGNLQYAGNVGTGFNQQTLRELRTKLDALGAERSPFAAGSQIPKKAHWVKPELICEVAFGEWTRDNRIRHSVFHGLRTDKPPQAIGREEAVHEAPVDKPAKAAKPVRPEPVEGLVKASTGSARTGETSAPTGKASARTESKTAAAVALPGTLRISNPQRVIDTESGVTKIALVRYYALVAPLMMPHLKRRPVSLVRAPDGISGQLFFQKHLERYKMAGVAQLDPAIFPGHPAMLEIASPEGLLSAAQMNVIEFHTWNGVVPAIGKPDRMAFDIDPGEGVAWPQIQEAAQLVRTLLDELELPVFLKTSGGKGLHLVVPLRKNFDWDTVKDFSEAVVLHLSRTLPDRFVAKSGPKNRVGRIFIDYLRNGYGATTACAWSARARPGLGISVPVGWNELPKLKGGAHWTVQSVHDRLDEGNEPWAGYEGSRAGLAAAMKKLGFERK